MKIRLLQTGVVRDCSADVGGALIDTGLAVELNPKEAVALSMERHPSHDLAWHAREGEWMGGGFMPPVLIWRCQTCAACSYQSPYGDPNNKNLAEVMPVVQLRVAHGVTLVDGKVAADWHECPADIARQYFQLFKQWASKSNRWKRSELQQIMNVYAEKDLNGRDARAALLRQGGVVTL